MKKVLAVLTISLLPMMAQADSKPTYDRITFSVSAEREVENDTTIATLYASEEGKDAAKLASKVNESIAWALAEAKKVEGIESRTLTYNTYPTYGDERRITGWRVRQNIRLKSTNSKALSKLLGVLQEKVQIESVTYGLSRQVQRKLYDELTGEALANFKRRAEQVKSNMGRDEYRVVKLDIHSDNQQVLPPAYRMAAMEGAMMAKSAAPAPSLSAGKQTIRVNVSSEIELSLN